MTHPQTLVDFERCVSNSFLWGRPLHPSKNHRSTGTPGKIEAWGLVLDPLSENKDIHVVLIPSGNRPPLSPKEGGRSQNRNRSKS